MEGPSQYFFYNNSNVYIVQISPLVVLVSLISKTSNEHLHTTLNLRVKVFSNKMLQENLLIRFRSEKKQNQIMIESLSIRPTV